MYLPTIIDVLVQIDGGCDIYYYNRLIKDGQAHIKQPTDGYLRPGQFKIIRRSFIGDARFVTRKEYAGDTDFNMALINKHPKCKFTGVFAYWYNFPRENSESYLHLRGLKY